MGDAFGGGGFMAGSPQGGGYGQGGGGGGEKKGGGAQRNEAIIPVTVKALAEAIQSSSMDDTVTIWGAELGNIALVAKVVRIQDSTTQMTYTLDDGTGRMDVKMWVEDDAGAGNAALKELLRTGTYVHATGSLRHFQGSKSFVAYHLRPITDMDEVTYHALDVITVCKMLKLKHGGGAGGGGHFGAAGAGLMAGGAPPANAAYGAYAAPKPAGGGGAGFQGGFSGNITSDVLAVFNSDMGRGDTGVALSDVANALQGRYTMDAIRAAVDSAVNEGHLYSTTDDSHYKSTTF